MTAATPAFTPSRRDAGLRRLRVFNRLLVVAMIVLTLVLAELASHGFHGRARAATPAPPRRATGSTGRHQSRGDDRGRESRSDDAVSRPRQHRLRPPAQPPTTAQTSAAPPNPTPSPSPAASPTPSPAPATVSGGS